MNNITQECLDIVKGLAGNEYLYFDTALEVRTSPHSFPFQAWGVCVSPQDEIYVMDGNQEWHKVEPNLGNAYLVLGSLYQRLQLIKRKFSQIHTQTTKGRASAA